MDSKTYDTWTLADAEARIAKLEQQNAALREAMFKACGQCMHGDAKRAADTLSAALAQEDGG